MNANIHESTLKYPIVTVPMPLDALPGEAQAQPLVESGFITSIAVGDIIEGAENTLEIVRKPVEAVVTMPTL